MENEGGPYPRFWLGAGDGGAVIPRATVSPATALDAASKKGPVCHRKIAGRERGRPPQLFFFNGFYFSYISFCR